MHKALIVLFFAFIALKCEGEKDFKANIKLKASSEKPNQQDQITFELRLPKNAVVDSIQYESGGKRIVSPLSLKNISLGKHELKATAFKGGKSYSFESPFWVYASEQPSLMKYRVINNFPHDPDAYTQGLEFKDNVLYESTGLNGKSSLRKVDFKSGEVLAEQKLDQVYFGEGITLIDNKIIQLTWRANMGFVYQQDDLKMIHTFPYENSKQGWGLCHDDTVLYKSDGTYQLWTLDPITLNETGKVDVMTPTKSVNKLNELEWVDGLIYANTYQFQKDVVVVIQPKTGAVTAVIDFTGLRSQLKNNPKAEAFNGIAYHPKRNTFFVTGKFWNRLFEVELYQE